MKREEEKEKRRRRKMRIRRGNLRCIEKKIKKGYHLRIRIKETKKEVITLGSNNPGRDI